MIESILLFNIIIIDPFDSFAILPNSFFRNTICSCIKPLTMLFSINPIAYAYTKFFLIFKKYINLIMLPLYILLSGHVNVPYPCFLSFKY